MKTIYKAAAIASALSISAASYAAFFAGGDNAKAAELANLKGEMPAIEQASIQKRGGISSSALESLQTQQSRWNGERQQLFP